jgi:DICT domain-containing protein
MHPAATLNQLKATLPSGQLPSSYGVYYKNTLVALCHALEDHILESQPEAEADKPLVLVTFQQGKWYLQEADRYFDLATASEHIAIGAVAESGLGDHRTSALDNVSLVKLDPSDALCQEWNLVILSPRYAAMLLAYELPAEEYRAEGVPTVDTERKFYGLWTFERSLVEATAKILLTRMQNYDSTLIAQLQAHEARIAQELSPRPLDLTPVVTRIVSYLQTSQEKLVTVSRQTRELWELEGQAVRLNRNLAANKLQAFLRMAQRVDERDPHNPVASLQVSALGETLGQLLELPTLQLRRLRLAGLLFRVGLAAAPAELLTQAQAPSAMNRSLESNRATLSARLLQTMPELAPITQIIAHDQEFWDGSGIPEGLKGEKIPLESRILGLVIYFQDLTQPRSDRPALSPNAALERCRELASQRFDPTLIELLAQVVQLAELGMMQLPERPGQLPTVWLEDSLSDSRKSIGDAAQREVSP